MAAVPQIGLDIGSASVRAVEARRGRDGPLVTNSAQAPLPAGAVQGGVIADDRAVTQALKQMWAATRLPSEERSRPR